MCHLLRLLLSCQLLIVFIELNSPLSLQLLISILLSLLLSGLLCQMVIPGHISLPLHLSQSLVKLERDKGALLLMTINACSNGTCQCRILTSFSKHCSSLFLWISLICCGVMPFQRSVRTRGPSAEDSLFLLAASGRSVRRSEVTMYRTSASSSPSLLRLSCCSFSILSSAYKGRSDVTLTFHLKDLWCLWFSKWNFCHYLLII